jgi:hypothetical protein
MPAAPSRNGTLLCGEHRLVIVLVLRIGGAARSNIRRQRHPTGAFEQQLDRLVPVEIQREAAIVTAIPRDGDNACAEIDRIVLLQAPRIADERPPTAWPLALVERRADLRIAAAPFQLRRNHARVVEDEQIARAQCGWEIRDRPVARLRAFQRQHPRGVARHSGAQRDPLWRQREIEQVDLHDVPLPRRNG